MAPSHTTCLALTNQNAEQNHAIFHQCPCCNRKFQKTGFKQHKASCRKCKEDEREHVAFECQYEEKQQDTGYFFVDEPTAVEVTMGQDYNETSDMLYTSDMLMPTSTSSNVAKLPEFKIQFHPRSNQPLIYQSYEEFRVHSEKSASLVDKTPWSPFCMLGDFESVEITLTSLLNQQQVNALLDLFAHVTQGAVQVMLKNDAELCKACDAAAMELTLFSRVKVKVPYKKEECTMALSMNVFMMSPGPEIIGGIFNLPDIKNAMPFGLILYADKSNLLSFGTAKSYPVIVPEGAEEEGKLGYTTLKHVIWHESFRKLLLEIEQYLKTGLFTTEVAYRLFTTEVAYRLFTTEVAYRWHSLVVAVANALSLYVLYHQSYSMISPGLLNLNVFWMIGFSDLHLTCSFDQLHYGHGFWGKHIFGDLKIEANVEKYDASFPHWQNLTHFNQVIHDTFSDGNKLADISKVITLVSIMIWAGIWISEHLFKGRLAGRQYDTLYSSFFATLQIPNFLVSFLSPQCQACPLQKETVKVDSLGPTKVCISQSKTHMNTIQMVETGPVQVLWVDHQVLATKLLRLHVDYLKKSVSGESDPEADVLGAHVITTQTLKELEENGQPDMAFHQFCQRFSYGYQVKSWISLPADFVLKLCLC
ncbi:hypothetical protein F5J12DRAFT_786022 [Pisolithus orientalis]|uniref:uncharacterized protein n=1 Tax=Pisolithus orientalis TaxID=936130 RepID=UPI002224EEE5|nr:uncharacterized protein F5J12DRAFT_786022 [Pisolithus orientalis]KAI5993146.1 hypothetical protein F5J12DRAFT_786022 [Pisolithus orientalis]